MVRRRGFMLRILFPLLVLLAVVIGTAWWYQPAPAPEVETTAQNSGSASPEPQVPANPQPVPPTLAPAKNAAGKLESDKVVSQSELTELPAKVAELERQLKRVKDLLGYSEEEITARLERIEASRKRSTVLAPVVARPRQPTPTARSAAQKTQKPTERRRILATAVSAEDSKLLLAYPVRKPKRQ